MANRRNHYEAAFESYLRKRGIPYLASLETHRNRLNDGETLKNLDFVVSAPGSHSWLVDVKGRKFPGGSDRSSYWKHWTSHDDLLGMAHWQSLFGDRFRGLFVFAYWICGSRSPLPEEQLFGFRGKWYAFIGVPFFEYLSAVRIVSPTWKTYAMPVRKFRSLARPFGEFCREEAEER